VSGVTAKQVAMSGPAPPELAAASLVARAAELEGPVELAALELLVWAYATPASPDITVVAAKTADTAISNGIVFFIVAKIPRENYLLVVYFFDG
jgi:hypothetical protein